VTLTACCGPLLKKNQGTGDEEPDTFRINTDDPRFADLFLKKDFEIDPTSSQ
jgi:hypothetical protein